MLEYNQIKPRKYIVFNNDPYEVIDSNVFRKQQRKPVNAAKLKNLISGKVVEHSFHQSDKVEEADIESREIKYLYTNRGEYWFSEVADPSKRFALSADLLGKKIQFVKPNSLVTALSFDEQIINITVPVKVELKVIEAPPAVRGNTAVGATKQITLETGTTVNSPLFIKTGDIVRINTETGEYVERA